MTTEQIDALHTRPSRMTVDQLDWDECDYFFSHASYTGDPVRTMRPALKYFLPRYAQHFAGERGIGNTGVMDCPEIFGTALRRSAWWRWQALQPLITEWLCAWLMAALWFEVDETDNATSLGESPVNEYRQCRSVMHCLLEAGVDSNLLQQELEQLTLRQCVRAAASFVSYSREGVRTATYGIPWTRTGIPTEALKRVRAGLAVVDEWVVSDRLRKQLENAVMVGVCPAAASEVYSMIELLRQSKK